MFINAISNVDQAHATINVSSISHIKENGEKQCIAMVDGQRFDLEAPLKKWKKLLKSTDIEIAGII